jgi:pyruvate carboxylase
VAGQVAAPFAGVVSLAVEAGAEVAAGDTVATIEAMKMEAAVTTPWPAPCSGWPSGRSSRSRAATCSW